MKEERSNFTMTRLQTELTITYLISIHYFEYSNNFHFYGEQHDFWELLYVDKGEVIVDADETQHKLQNGDMIFHKPNQWHSVHTNGINAPNLIVIAFKCDSACMSCLNDKIIRVDNGIKKHLIRIIIEAKKTYRSKLNNPKINHLIKSSNPDFASEQLIKLSLEEILIQLIRDESHVPRLNIVEDYEKGENISSILNMLNNNIGSHLTLNDISHLLHLSKPTIMKEFKKHTGISIMEYFTQLKIDRAKTLIREGHYNITQIADMLGYNSIHYFSRVFNKVTGMRPTEYASSIKSFIDDI